jgi:DNA-binding MarR family transcriptional regulator
MSRIEEAADAINEIMAGSKKNMMEQLGRSGKGELFVLKYLCGKNSSVIPSEISDAMHASTARISAALGSLEKKDQIRREIDKSNRRNILVTVTEKGRERNRSEMLQMREKLIGVFTEMGERDAAELVRLIKRFFEISNRIIGYEKHKK